MKNGMLIQFFHWYYPSDGSLWKFLTQESNRLSELGVTAVWLPPAYKGSEGANSAGYDVYDLYDLGEFDQKKTVRTKYGTKEEYLQAIEAAHKAGMQVYADVILNHLCGADATEKIQVKKVNPDNRNEFISDVETIEADLKFEFPGRNKKYSAFVWDHQCFSGVDFAKDRNEKGIFKIMNEYGEGWENVADSEHGNYDYLLGSDIEFRNPAVREELKRWGEWYCQQTGIDGFRLDAIKHIAPDYLKEWLDHLRHITQREMFTVGEYWSPEKPEDMLRFIDLTESRMSLFDAPLHHKFYLASCNKKNFDLRTIFDNTLTQSRPALSVTLVGNHDTQPGQLLETCIESWFRPLAYSLILLRSEGYPCVFFPDLYGARFTYQDKDGNKKSTVTKPVPNLEKMMKGRSRFVHGQQRDYFDDPVCIGWTHEGDEEHPGSGCAVVMSSKKEGRKKMEIGKQHAGKIFYDYLGNSNEQLKIQDDGWGEFSCGKGNLSVWVQK